MNIIVENLGPIKKAEFNLNKQLSVFCGPNNTGKTYLSYVLYAYTRRRIYLPDERLSEEQVSSFITTRLLHINFDEKRVYELISQRLKNIKKDLGIIFGLSDEKAKRLFPKFRIKLDKSEEKYKEELRAKSYEFEFHLTRNVIVKANKREGDNIITLKNLTKTMDESDLEEIRYNLLTATYHYLVVSPIYDSHFFPVERTSMFTYHKDIQGTRNKLINMLHAQDGINQQQTISFIMNNSSQFPLVIGQTLDTANNMGQMRKKTGYYAKLADEIEHSIMKGKLIITEDGDLQFAAEGAMDKIVPLQLSASMEKAISGIVFYLRHISGKGDMVFIDEPEVNCHPNVQVLMTRIFAKMVNAGLRIVISTHSDYIIRELNNLIMLKGTTEVLNKDLERWGYTKDMRLSHEDVAAYLFTYGNRDSVIMKPIAVTDSGFEVSTIDATINQQNEISQALYYNLRYGK